MDNEDTKNGYRYNEKDFTWTRKFSYKTLIIFMVQFGKSNIQHEFDDIFENPEYTITKVAYTLQRKKVKCELFQDLNSLI
ncbi:MAG: hypothetical protein ACI9FN_002000 [Saprospiraceae bacterium]